MNIESITVCEDTTSDFKPINITNTFYPEQSGSVQVLVQLSEIHTTTDVNFQWYISDEPEVPLATYTFTLERKSKKTRYAVGALDLRALLQLKEFNIFQKWFTIIEVEDSKRRVDFFLKKMGYGPSTLSNNFVNVPRINLKG
ncbi:hypothetical protein [Paenibacillus sp. MZ03-122A]|uniref:hypothetical protein n=1 Tax=Paenibacillus sp. MZ03-122A TaxID=2962033 RepID=UPI0019DEB6E8|nr:hypothetical protein [Paenibacillus sp. MZ03-122A]KAF6627797.1 hypothetical protein H6F38_21940 [Paenibacillus sp. EKM208P]MCP3780914.1 hypothetical protein [Paenibacillus sp. MZ03-122A]